MDRGLYFKLLLEGKFKEAELERVKLIPKKLYKYISLNGSHLDEKNYYTLEHECLWFSNVEAFNDPYEQRVMTVDRDSFHRAGYPDGLIDIYERLFDCDDIKIS